MVDRPEVATVVRRMPPAGVVVMKVGMAAAVGGDSVKDTQRKQWVTTSNIHSRIRFLLLEMLSSFENSLMVQEASRSHGLLKSSGSDRGLELIQEKDTQPSENTSEVHNQVASIEEYELGDLNEPPYYKAALSYLEFEKWPEAMNTKMQSMKDNQVWVLVDLPPNNLREASYIFGIKIIRDRSKRLITLRQSAYLKEILKKFWMENSKKGYTPMIENPDYRKSQGAKTPSEQNTSEIHWIAVKTILKYLRNTKDMVLVYREKPKAELKLSCYADAKAECIVAAEASMEVVWMRKFIDGLGNVVPSNKRPMEMLCDNAPEIAIANDLGILKGARHFQRKYHYIREVIQEREIVLKKVHR
nr:hypothetical protein [Tanacetum cinerariifolium]